MKILRAPLIATLFSISICAYAGSDGYINWAEVSFSSGKYLVHIKEATKNSPVIIEIKKDNELVDLPSEALEGISGYDLFINDAELVYLCCQQKVKLEIPLIKFDKSGNSTRRTWEIFLGDSGFERAGYGKESKSEF